MNVYVTGAGVIILLVGLLGLGGLIPLSVAQVNTSATITNPSVTCSGASNVQCNVSLTFNNVNANCAGTWSCGVSVQVWACRVLPSPTSELACTQSWTNSNSPFPLVSLGQQSKTVNPTPGSSVNIAQGFTFSYYPVYYFVISASDSSFNQIAEWDNFATGTIPAGGGTGFKLVMEPTGQESNGCTTTPSKGTTTVSGSVTLAAVGSCPVNSGTATFSGWTFYTGIVSNGQETWSQTGTSNSNPTSYNVAADTEAFPSYSCSNCQIQPPPLTLNVLSQAGTGISIAPTSATLTSTSSSAAFTISAQSGYSLTGWSGWNVIGCIAPNSVTGTSTSVTFTFSQLEACVNNSPTSTLFYLNTAAAIGSSNSFNVIGNPGVGVTISPTSAALTPSSSSTSFTISAQSGYSLAGWSGWSVTGCSATSPITGTASTVPLTYAQLQGCGGTNANTLFYLSTGAALGSTVSLEIAGDAGGTTSPAYGLYPETAGSSVTVTEAPASGYQFTGWTVTQGGSQTNGGTASSITLTMPQPSLGVPATVFLGATFVQIPPTQGETLFVGCVLGVVTSPPCGPTTETGAASVQVGATPNAGYVFCSWVVDGQPANSAGQPFTSNPITVTFKGTPGEYHSVAPVVETTGLPCGNSPPPPPPITGPGLSVLNVALIAGGGLTTALGLRMKKGNEG